jgi:hypothetical protein
MIELIQSWIWNIGGFLFTIVLIFTFLAWISSYAVNRLTLWVDNDKRKYLLYFIKNKKQIIKYIDDREKKEQKN